MNITFKNYQCEAQFGLYYNGKTAIQLIGKPETEYEAELITIASVNGEMDIPNHLVGIKTWSENEGIVQALVDGNVIEPELQFTEPTGFAAIEYYKLSNAALEEVRKIRRS